MQLRFFVGVMAFSAICKSNYSIWYIMGVKFAWGNLLMGFMCYSAVKSQGIYYGAVRSSGKLLDEVIDTLGLWWICGNIIAIEVADGAYEIRAGIFHNMLNFPYMCTEFSYVALLQVM